MTSIKLSISFDDTPIGKGIITKDISYSNMQAIVDLISANKEEVVVDNEPDTETKAQSTRAKGLALVEEYHLNCNKLLPLIAEDRGRFSFAFNELSDTRYFIKIATSSRQWGYAGSYKLKGSDLLDDELDYFYFVTVAGENSSHIFRIERKDVFDIIERHSDVESKKSYSFSIAKREGKWLETSDDRIQTDITNALIK
jgi:hypothetical protein